MHQRRSTIRPIRRHPALAAVALVALAPMLPADAMDDPDAGTADSGDGVDPAPVDDGDPGDGEGDGEGDGDVVATGGDDPIEEVAEEEDPAESDLVSDAESDTVSEDGDTGDAVGDEGVVDDGGVGDGQEPGIDECADPVAEPDVEAGDPEPGTTEDSEPLPASECEPEGLDESDGVDEGDAQDDAAEPVADEPVVDEPVVDEPVVDESDGVDEGDTQDDAAEPVVDEPVVDEPVPDEPVVDEPVVDVAPDPGPAASGTVPAERSPAPADEVPVVAPPEVVDDPEATTDEETDDPGLRAERYDGVYAQGVPVWVAMTATRHLESRGNYEAEARGSTASGAYQVIDSTWNGYGGYRRAVDAPAAVQDQFAYESMVAILKRHGNDVSSIPVAWYYPAALRNPALMDIVPVPQAGNVLTPRQYQARWMAFFHQHLEAGSPVFLPADTDPLIPAIAFPVLGPTSFWDDWHAPRDGGLRRHEGLDFMGENGQPLRAAFDGVVTRIRPNDVGRPGIGITITRADGIRANYFHLDTEFTWHPDLEVGDTVKAGQVIAFMGDTGNAGVPHLHFELRTEEGEPIAPYAAALEAVQREQCSVGIGPWSTAFDSPAEVTESLARAAEIAAETARIAAQMRDLGLVAEPGDPEMGDLATIDAEDLVEPVVHEVEGPDGARWTISEDGAVTAWGSGALIAPDQGECEQIPELDFGTDAGGLGLDLLPEEWWGDDVDPDELAEMIAAVQAERSGEFDARRVDPSIAATRLRIGAGGILAAVTRPVPEDVSALEDPVGLVD